MTDILRFILYLLVMAGVTYLVRMLPLVFCRKKIKSRFVKSFLYYIPYTVLSVMTFPAIFYCTGSVQSAVVGTLVSVVLAFLGRGLLTVAAGSAISVLLVELIIKYLI